jgi:hypothetical protein
MPDSAIIGIDHALVGVRDLEAARAAWQAMGFTVTPRGRHIGWGTANYCVMLHRGYVELLGILDPGQFTNNLDKFLAGREGPMGLAFGSRDSERTARWLGGQGFHPDGPKDLARALELPSGDAMPAFKLVHLPPAETPGIRAFFCQHLSPEIVRWPGYLLHANKAVALETVIAVADDPAALAEPYRRLFGAAAVTPEENVLKIATGQGELWFVTPDELARLYGNIEIPRQRAPWLAAMRISVLILADTADYLDWMKVRIVPTGVGVAVPPEFAAGAIVEFVTAQPN